MLAVTSVAVVVIGALLRYTAEWERYFGSAPPPAEFYFILAGIVVAYLAMVEMAKRMLYRSLGPDPALHAAVPSPIARARSVRAGPSGG